MSKPLPHASYAPLIGASFAWMEMIKTLATLFKTFRFERLGKEKSTVLHEGFFVKAEECWVEVTVR